MLRLHRIFSAAFLVGGWLACNSPTDPKTPEYWLDRVDSDRPEQRDEALHKLGELKDAKAVDPLLKLFKESPADRPGIAEALGQIGDKRTVPVLVNAIDVEAPAGTDDESKLQNRINEKAAGALGMLKAGEASDKLLKLFGHSHDQYVRQAVVTAMGGIADKSFVPTLADIIEHEDNMFLKRVAAEALGNIGDPAGVPALILGLFVEKGGSIYPQASFALMQIGAPAIGPVLDTLNHKNEAVNKIAKDKDFAEGVLEVKSIEVLGDLKARQAEDAMIKLFTDLKNPQTQPILRRNVAIALAQIGSKKGVELLAKNASEPAGDLRQFYVDALNELGDRGALPALLTGAKTGPDPDGKLAAFIAYTRLGDAREMAAATALTTGKDEVSQKMAKELVRLEAAKTCGDNFDCWLGKLKDRDARVRDRAAYALGRIGDKKAAEPLAAVLRDENLDTRYASVWALGKVGSGAQVAALQKVLSEEKGQQQYVRVNEYLKRLIVDLKRAK